MQTLTSLAHSEAITKRTIYLEFNPLNFKEFLTLIRAEFLIRNLKKYRRFYGRIKICRIQVPCKHGMKLSGININLIGHGATK